VSGLRTLKPKNPKKTKNLRKLKPKTFFSKNLDFSFFSALADMTSEPNCGKNAPFCNGEQSFEKFLDPDTEEDDFQRLITTHTHALLS